ncbi:hypothetical protein ILUMI_04168 [Ignelater luminosus]|uniref:Uncharacterized protein n=1 Tax=Ignelater luminosus TaxID=2038154 RepID=A0A8K0DF88_IGNLU|nr:hypothetical protein ILUMI_04168 [Ignelater luminosus]
MKLALEHGCSHWVENQSKASNNNDANKNFESFLTSPDVGVERDQGTTNRSHVLVNLALAKKFYEPRKDQCWCYEYNLKKSDDQAEKLEGYELLKKRKDAENSAKKEDGERAKYDKTFVTVDFDLEAALYCPLFSAKPILYKRKLAVYNFTIYEVATKQGHCFL